MFGWLWPRCRSDALAIVLSGRPDNGAGVWWLGLALVARERERVLLSSCARPLVVRGARQPCHSTPATEADGGGRVVDVDGKVPDGWYADIAGWDVPPRWRRELDEIIATLSYDGWQDDVAGMKDARNPWEEMRRMRRKQQVHDLRLTQPGRPAPLDEVEDEIK